MTQEELLQRIRQATGEARALQLDPESLANQARLMVAEATRRGIEEGIQRGRLQLMSEMITNPNRN